MSKRLSDGASFSNTGGGIRYGAPVPDIYVSHNNGDKSGSTLLSGEDRVVLDLGNGDTRLMTYGAARALAGHLGLLVAEYDAHRAEKEARELARKMEEYRAKLKYWENGLRENSVNTFGAITALFDGKHVRLLENVLGDSTGKGWEVYAVDRDGQVMVTTNINKDPHLSSHGPLSATAKNKRWVVCPFPARPTMP